MANLLAVGSTVTSGELGTAALQAVIGFLIVILGIVLLIAILSLVGFIMTRNKKKGKAKAKPQAVSAPVFREEPRKEEAKVVVQKKKESSEIPEEVKVAIIAAIMAYYQAEKPQAAFIVKRIKRI